MKIDYALSEIENAANQILNHRVHDIILFDAPMGAGKTTLIKEISKQLGVDGEVSSPTFSLVNEYQGSEIAILHFDLYRIESEAELMDIGMEDYLERKALKLIEWPKHAMDMVEVYHTLKIEIIGEDRRRIEFV